MGETPKAARIAAMRAPLIPPVTPERLAQAFHLAAHKRPGEWNEAPWARAFRTTLQTQLQVTEFEAAHLAVRVASLLNLFVAMGPQLRAAGHFDQAPGQTSVSRRLMEVASRAPVTPTGFPEAHVTQELGLLSTSS